MRPAILLATITTLSPDSKLRADSFLARVLRYLQGWLSFMCCLYSLTSGILMPATDIMWPGRGQKRGPCRDVSRVLFLVSCRWLYHFILVAALQLMTQTKDRPPSENPSIDPKAVSPREVDDAQERQGMSYDVSLLVDEQFVHYCFSPQSKCPRQQSTVQIHRQFGCPPSLKRA